MPDRTRPATSQPDAHPAPSRRGFFLGAAAASAAVAAVAVLPKTAPEAVAEAALPPPPEKGGGYTLSAHVQRYYQTARRRVITGKASDLASSSPFSSACAAVWPRPLPTMDRAGFPAPLRSGRGRWPGASQLTLVKKAQGGRGAAPGVGTGKIEVKRTICTHCSVGCAVDAVVENGVWVRQEPVFDSPINLGAHCAKGAALREHGHGEYRLRYPMKLVNGKYQRISWDTALDRDHRQDAGAAQGQRPGQRVFCRLVQAQQRTGLPAAQVRQLLGQQQLRPPGPHLPLHHGGRCGQHLGLRRHDQFVQRHAKQQGRFVHRLQCGRGPPVSACCTCCMPRKPAAR
jgi:hypothetical protein